jgi:acyl dehydratase
VPPRPPALVRDYVRHVGGDPAAYRGLVPPHLYPQWAMPLAARVLRDMPYPAEKALNAGTILEINGPLPADQPIELSARLESVDDNGRRAILQERITSGPASQPDALVAFLSVLVPLAGKKESRDRGRNGGRSDGKQPARVPLDAREIGYWRLGADAGLAFAMLTGDFNPVHWVPAYARAFGFRSTILHGFATLARAIEGMNRVLFAGAADRFERIETRFTRPLLLPARVGLYVEENRFFVGDAPGGPAYLTGSFSTRSR